MFDQQKFYEFLLDHEVVGFFDAPITLKSGRQSHWYVNWRNVAGDVFLLDRLSDFLLAFVADHQLSLDAFYGVPEGATKLSLITTYKWALQQKGYAPGSHPFPMGRAKLKEHGVPADRYFVGPPRGKTVVIEDVTTTGGSLLTEIDKLSETNIDIVAAIGLTNRMERREDGKGVAHALKEKGVRYYALSQATDFLPLAMARFNPPLVIKQAIEKEFQEYGLKQLSF